MGMNMGCYDRFLASSVRDLKSAALYKALVAELIGVMLLVLVSCSSPYGESNEVKVDNTKVSLAFGLSVATLVWILSHVSGGHINPAVTAGVFVARKISFARCILYIIFQLIGGIIGSALEKALICDWQLAFRASQNETAIDCELGGTVIAKGLGTGQAFGIEFFITFILVATVLAAIDETRNDLGGSGPLAIGFSVAMCHLAFKPLTGASMNTARTFGPAVMTGNFNNHWVYWLGPILGGILAGLVYEFLFAGDATTGKIKAWAKEPNYHDNENIIDPSKKNYSVKAPMDEDRL